MNKEGYNMLYKSHTNPKIKELTKLKTKKYRDKQNLFIIEGKHLVQEAYKNGYLKELLLLENEEFKLDVETNYINKNILKILSTVPSPSGIIGICEKPKSSLKGNRLLILDSIQDPGNLGTIIRSSVAFNIDTIIINDNCADPYNDKTVRASQGMIFYCNIIKENLFEFIKQIKGKIPIYGTKVDNGKDLKTIEKNSSFAIIMGNEGSGVDKELLNMCDEYIYIPMNSNCESLNVGVATSIILYELMK